MRQPIDVTVLHEAADEIERLRAENDDSMLELGKRNSEICALVAKIEGLREELAAQEKRFSAQREILAASQARESMLREALNAALSCADGYYLPALQDEVALAAAPSDDSALAEAISQAKQEVAAQYERDIRVKSLRAAKQEVLREAAEWFDDGYEYSAANTTAKELRKMAEKLK
jgi:hypothetical protein